MTACCVLAWLGNVFSLRRAIYIFWVINAEVSTSSQISHRVNRGRTFFRNVGNTFKKYRRVITETDIISATNTVKAWKLTHKFAVYTTVTILRSQSHCISETTFT